MKGWIKLHRKVMESSTFSRLTATQKLIAIYIILNANHEDGVWYDKYKDIEVPVKRGQLIVSRNKIANEWFKEDKEITEQKIRTCLKKLEKFNFLTIKTTKHYTLLEVLNYSVYQQKEIEANQDINQEPTKQQPSTNQALTTNKNVKNDKNDKNNNSVVVDEQFKNLIQVYESNISTLAPIVVDRMNHWINHFEEPYPIIEKAIGIATLNNKRNMNYIEGVLKRWDEAGCKSFSDVENNEMERARNVKEGKSYESNRGSSQRTESESRTYESELARRERYRPSFIKSL